MEQNIPTVGVWHFFYGNAVSLEKQPQSAVTSNYLKQRLRAKIETDKMIAHIRLATRGTMDYENTHPFVMRDNYDRTWTLAHNGTIFESEVLEPFVAAEDGDTDSERILCYIIDQVNAAQDEKGAALTKEERFALLNRIILEIAPENKLNLLILTERLCTFILIIKTACTVAVKTQQSLWQLVLSTVINGRTSQ